MLNAFKDGISALTRRASLMAGVPAVPRGEKLASTVLSAPARPGTITGFLIRALLVDPASSILETRANAVHLFQAPMMTEDASPTDRTDRARLSRHCWISLTNWGDLTWCYPATLVQALDQEPRPIRRCMICWGSLRYLPRTKNPASKRSFMPGC